MRSPKGSVTVEAFKNRLRLYWSYKGKRFYLYIGLPDSVANRKAAEMKALQIELDIASGNFDPTLGKYKSDRQKQITVLELYSKFVAWKQDQITSSTMQKYEALRSHLTKFFQNRSALLSESEAEKFKTWMGQRVEPQTVRERIVTLSACWEWGIKRRLIKENPWLGVKVSIPPRQPTEPFTVEEVTAIVQKFRNDPRYNHYGDYVEFKFRVGARTGEVAALKWRHIASDFSKIWIGESINGPVKNNRGRMVPLSGRLREILINRMPEKPHPDDLIFTTTNGCLINSRNFCRRYWKPALEDLGIKYRRPYQTRHTLISHALEQGMNPVNLARLTGHDPKTLFDYYAGVVKPPELPELNLDD